MAFSLNRAQLIGNVTRPPEVRIAGGQKVATFSVATNFSWKDQSGQRKEKAEFHNVVVWRKLAEICEQYLKKGTKIYVEGRIQTRDWEGEDGVKRYRTEIVADNIIMLDKKGDSTGSYAPAAGADEEREQRSVRNTEKIASAKSEDSPSGKETPQEGVAIDDLPF